MAQRHRGEMMGAKWWAFVRCHVLGDQRRPGPESGRNGPDWNASRPAPSTNPGINREAMARAGSKPNHKREGPKALESERKAGLGA
jgi:hypothetical protein